HQNNGWTEPVAILHLLFRHNDSFRITWRCLVHNLTPSRPERRRRRRQHPPGAGGGLGDVIQRDPRAYLSHPVKSLVHALGCPVPYSGRPPHRWLRHPWSALLRLEDEPTRG